MATFVQWHFQPAEPKKQQKLAARERAKGHINKLKKFKGSREINHAKQLKGDRLATLKVYIHHYIPVKEMTAGQFNAIVDKLLPGYIPKNPIINLNFKKMSEQKQKTTLDAFYAEQKRKDGIITKLLDKIGNKKNCAKLKTQVLIEWLWKGLNSNLPHYNDSDVKKLAASSIKNVSKLNKVLSIKT